MDLKFDLPGKVRNTRLYASHWLKPLFEAVSNSIQSIQDSKRKDGLINITVDRGIQGRLMGDVVGGPIEGFLITDNGVGFTDDNFRSFTTADSRYKESRGCKGVGRFIWLKAYSRVEIRSEFKEGGKHWLRTFNFVNSPEGIEGATLTESKSIKQCTTVKLFHLGERFQKEGPKTAETIAQRVVEYCLPQFAQGKAPRITLTDSDGTVIDLAKSFAEMKFFQTKISFKVKDKSFAVTHLLVPASKEQTHRLHLCANGWSVKSETLVDKIAELRSQSSPIRDLEHGGRQLHYTGFLTGEMLDEAVSGERIDFAFDEEDGMFSSEAGITKSMLMEEAVKRIGEYLTPHLQEVRLQRDRQVENHVFTRSPQYRPLIKHRPEVVKEIPPNLTPEKLELKLYEANQHYNIELNQTYHDLLEKGDKKVADLDEHRRRVESFLQEWNEEGMAKLAWHVAHRKATLTFLEQELKLDGTGQYRLEDAIHRVVFPLKSTSDDVAFENQNLWIIDEKLAYHFYLASDVQLRKVKPANVDAKDRPDLIIFNNPMAVVDAAGSPSIVIIEFKRAMRDDYTDADNPVLQVINYVKKLKTGQGKDRQGRPIEASDRTAYYAFIVCDPSSRLDDIALNYQLKATPDGRGFFGYHGVGVYIEIILFSKLISNAQARNQRLFDLLGFRTVAPADVISDRLPTGGIPLDVDVLTPPVAEPA